MPITTAIATTSKQRTVLTHYAPGEECRAHRHSGAQISLLLAGDYVEDSDAGFLAVGGISLSCKPGGFEHQNRFGQAGALILSMHGLAEDFATPSYRVSPCKSRTDGLRVLAESAATGIEPAPARHTGPDASQQPVGPWLDQAKGRLLAEPAIPISTLARSIGVHPVHFARVFRQAFGRPPAQMRRDHRTARVINRIVRTSSALAEIADAEGFADQAHMTRAVCDASGWSPGALRRLLAPEMFPPFKTSSRASAMALRSSPQGA